MGGVLIFEVEQGMTLYRISQLCTSYMVATKLSSPVSGIMAVNHAFQVIVSAGLQSQFAILYSYALAAYHTYSYTNICIKVLCIK